VLRVAMFRDAKHVSSNQIDRASVGLLGRTFTKRGALFYGRRVFRSEGEGWKGGTVIEHGRNHVGPGIADVPRIFQAGRRDDDGFALQRGGGRKEVVVVACKLEAIDRRSMGAQTAGT
jgi:hypothetical protein